MRLFIGIAPDGAARRALCQTAQALQPAAPGRYVDAPLYHLTLAFLGEVEAGAVPAVCAAMQTAASCVPPFALRLGGIGRFGTVLWRGVLADESLKRLAASLRAALDSAGIAYDRKPFRPHITLAREVAWREGADAPPLPRAVMPVKRLTLYESLMRQGHLAYEARAEAVLMKETNAGKRGDP